MDLVRHPSILAFALPPNKVLPMSLSIDSGAQIKHIDHLPYLSNLSSNNQSQNSLFLAPIHHLTTIEEQFEKENYFEPTFEVVVEEK